jgi:hypothetical protein
MTSISLLDEIYDNEKIEKDTFRSMRELSKFTKILSKGNNLYVIIKKKLHQIKLSSPKPLFKISLLLDTLPEETLSFTFYKEEKNEPKDIILNNININDKKIKKKQKPKKSEDIYIINNIESRLAEEIYKNGKGNIIGYNYCLFKLIWKYIYLLGLIISLISFVAFIIFSTISILNKEYYILFGNIITLITLCLSIIACRDGYKKINSKRRINFRLENVILICFLNLSAFCGIFWIYAYAKNEIELELIILVSIEIILCFLDIISLMIIWLNIKMTHFYEEYSTLYEVGTSLDEI